MEITHGPILSVQINSQPGDQPVWKHLKVKKQTKKTLPQDSKLKSENVTASCHCVRNHYFKNTCYECPEISGCITSKYSFRIPGNPTAEHSSKRVVFNQEQFHRPPPSPRDILQCLETSLLVTNWGEEEVLSVSSGQKLEMLPNILQYTERPLQQRIIQLRKCQQLRYAALRYSKAFKKKIRFCYNQKIMEQVEMTY